MISLFCLAEGTPGKALRCQSAPIQQVNGLSGDRLGHAGRHSTTLTPNFSIELNGDFYKTVWFSFIYKHKEALTKPGDLNT